MFKLFKIVVNNFMERLEVKFFGFVKFILFVV